ncbi:MAG: SCO family protein [Phycisphaerales bacterium]|nr:SCO family protein [Phycisphaerales bacterium]
MTGQDQHNGTNPSSTSELQPSRGFWVLTAVTVLAVSGLAYLQYARADRSGKGRSVSTSHTSLPVLGQLPDFTLTERSGKKVSLGDLKGEVWVADFIFTHCGGPCPIMTRRMRELNEALKAQKLDQVRTVSISVDPETDTPKVLREYATMFKADGYPWFFLTGDQDEIFDLSQRGFMLTAQNVEDSDQVDHSPRFVLVDKKGQIRGYYEIVTDAEMEQPRAEVIDKPMSGETRQKLLNDIRSLLRESA